MGDCARSQNRPLWVCDRLAEELHSVPDQDNCSAREQLTLLSMVLYESSSAAGVVILVVLPPDLLNQ